MRSLRSAASVLGSLGKRLLRPRMYRSVRESWSQEGEDLILARFMEPRVGGFYVDVGAHDPFRFSNTAYFYARGWVGINIEPDPIGARRIRHHRPKDVVVNLGVGPSKSNMTMFRFNEMALNTFSSELAEQRQRHSEYKVVEKIMVPIDRLENILAEHLSAGQKIDFMTVDAEGFDLEVLKSNDWERFRPEIVVAECFHHDLEALRGDAMPAFMNSVDYQLVAKAVNSVFFAAKEHC